MSSREGSRGGGVAIWKDESRFGGLATHPIYYILDAKLREVVKGPRSGLVKEIQLLQ